MLKGGEENESPHKKKKKNKTNNEGETHTKKFLPKLVRKGFAPKKQCKKLFQKEGTK